MVYIHTHNMHEQRHMKTPLLNRIMKGFNKCYFEPHLGYDKTHAEFNSQKANNLCFFFPLNFIQEKIEEEDSPGKALNLCHAQGLIHTTKNSIPNIYFSSPSLEAENFPKGSTIVLFCQVIAFSAAHQACFQRFCVLQGACN